MADPQVRRGSQFHSLVANIILIDTWYMPERNSTLGMEDSSFENTQVLLALRDQEQPPHCVLLSTPLSLSCSFLLSPGLSTQSIVFMFLMSGRALFKHERIPAVNCARSSVSLNATSARLCNHARPFRYTRQEGNNHRQQCGAHIRNIRGDVFEEIFFLEQQHESVVSDGTFNFGCL